MSIPSGPTTIAVRDCAYGLARYAAIAQNAGLVSQSARHSSSSSKAALLVVWGSGRGGAAQRLWPAGGGRYASIALHCLPNPLIIASSSPLNIPPLAS